MLSVLEAAADRRLVSIADVKTELDISSSAENAWISKAIRTASLAAEHYCKRIFSVERVIETLRPSSCAEKLMLARVPVVAIETVTIDGAEVDEADLELEPETGFLWKLSSDLRVEWPSGKIAITYSAGFAAIPADVAKAVILLVSGYRSARGRDPSLRSEQVDGVGSFSYALAGAVGGAEGGLPGEVTGLLDFYKLASV